MSATLSSGQRALHRAKLVSIREVAPAHYQMRLEAPALAQTALPGQFVHICTRPNSEDFSYDPLLRRAFSIMNVSKAERNAIDVLFRVEGRGTRALASAHQGDEFDLIGPLGQPFDISPFKTSSQGFASGKQGGEMFHVKQFAPTAIVVGGGVGVPPLVYLSEMLSAMNIDVHAVIGARTSSDVIGWQELAGVCREVAVATDDGSRGHQGRVTDLLAPLIEKLQDDEGASAPIVYACGPWPMLRAVAQLCATYQVRCQVSLEENMPCGIGVCNGCVVRAKKPFAENQEAGTNDVNQRVGNEWSPYQSYRRVCVEGPACWADEIDWEHQG